ncbi:MAG: hypothetical protein OXN19_04965 [Caldilineaceae bacterium]|nr:hypothetical protein [Caldilineaceae bacterium]
MSWDMAAERDRLDDWEERLREEIGEGGLLLGELGYTNQHLEEIGGLLFRTTFYRLLQSASIDIKLSQVSTYWPLTFALYLVLEGIHNYGEEGFYWHGPKKRLMIEDNHTAPCGRCFRRILAQHNLPVFPQSRGFINVTPILLHGGIPNSSLGEFFDFLYRHEIQPHSITIDAQTLVEQWRRQVDNLADLSKPVSRFIRYGGLVAEDFVSRCLELFRIADETEVDESGLPERVWDAFWSWKEQGANRLRPQPTRRPRLQRPIFRVEPYASGVRLDLPPQQMSSRAAPRKVEWLIASGEQTQLVDTTRQRIENGYRYDATTAFLSIPPAEDYSVQLLADERLFQEWVIPGFGASPLLVLDPFDDYEADAVGEQEWHKQGERWLLYPSKYSLRASGGSQRIRQLPQMTGDWQDYSLEVWMLSPGKLSLLNHNGDQVHLIHVEEERKRRRPYLEGGEQPLSGLALRDFPLFCGHPPTLVIHTTQPQRWQVSLRGEGNAQPRGVHSYRLSELSVQRHDSDGRVSLDLSDPRLLGRNPIGRFEITVRGPLGHNYTLGLRVIPKILIEGHDSVYLSQPDEPAKVRIVTDEGTTIRNTPPQMGIASEEKWLSKGRREYVFTIEAHIQQVALQLAHQSGVSVPVAIPIRRLRWSLFTGMHTDREPQWQTEATSIFPGGLAGNAELRVMVPLFGGGKKIYLGWRMLDVDGQVVRAVSPSRKTLLHLITIPLTEVLGIWREEEGTLQWQWELHVEDQTEEVRIDALYLLPDLGSVQHVWKEENDQVRLAVRWETPHPGKKELQLWPQDRPWIEMPITTSAPDKEDLTRIEWLLPKKDLPSESYLGEIVPYNPWASQRPQRPVPDKPNTVLIRPPGLSGHYAEIAQLRDLGKAKISQLLALLAHQHDSNQGHKIHKTNQAVTNLREELPLIWLVYWAETTRRLDNAAYKLTQLRMFDKPVMERLKQGELPDDALERYFNHLPLNIPAERLHLWAPLYIWVLQSGLPAVPRQRCLELLCSLPLDEAILPEVMEALLVDVGDASILVSEAVDLLKNYPQAAANFLAAHGSPDAVEVLHELALRGGLDISWIWSEMTLDTNAGRILVHSLRERGSGETLFCAPLSSDCYAEGTLQLSPFALSVRLDLHNRLLHFRTHHPYQCLYCDQLFSDMPGYTRHHDDMHNDQPQARRRLKQNTELAWIRPLLDDDRQEEQS